MRSTRSISSIAISGFVRADLPVLRDPCACHPLRHPLSRSQAGTAASPPSQALHATPKVVETSDWQLDVLPSEEASCDATPTDCCPFFGSAVSSMTRKPERSPTKRSASFKRAALSGALSHTPCSNEVMKLVVSDITSTRSHWLDAFTVTGPDQTSNVRDGQILRRAGCDSPAKNGSSHRSRSFQPGRTCHHRQSARQSVTDPRIRDDSNCFQSTCQSSARASDS